MSFTLNGTTVYLTRGDTFETVVEAVRPDSEEAEVYIPMEGDSVRFALKSRYEDPKPLLIKDIPIDTMTLTLEPEDTKPLPFGKYVYDIQITFANGKRDTFIPKGRLYLTEEVE